MQQKIIGMKRREKNEQKINFVVDNNVLAKSQPGFRCSPSTMLFLWQQTTGHMSLTATMLMLLDLKKVFDTVDHGILLSEHG